MSLGVGIVGCGGMGRVYAECLATLPDCRLVAAYDVEPERTQAFVRDFGCRAGPSAEDVIHDSKVDCVYICTRHDSHLALVREVAQSRKPVYCEKPMGLDLAQAIEIHRLVKERSLLFTIGFNHRRSPGNLKAKELTERSLRPFMINVTFACPHFLESWMGTPEQGGGILNSLGCHAFDLSCHFAEDVPVEVISLAARLRIPEGFLDDTAAVAVKFRGGTIASLSLHDHAPDPYVWEPGRGLLRVEVFGRGTAVVSTGSRDVVYCLGHQVERIEFGPYLYRKSWGYHKATEDFVQAVRQQAPILPDEDDGLLSAYLVDAAQRAVSTNQTVRLTGLPEVLAERGR